MKGSLDILYEDDDVIALNKPAGLVVHQGAGVKDEETLADILLIQRPEIQGVGEGSERPGIVHRLDKDTSGVLAVAKTEFNPSFPKTFQMYFPSGIPLIVKFVCVELLALVLIICNRNIYIYVPCGCCRASYNLCCRL